MQHAIKSLLLSGLLLLSAGSAQSQATSGDHIQYGIRYNKDLKRYEVSYQTNSLAPASPTTTSTAQVFIVVPDAQNGSAGQPDGKYNIGSFTVTSSYNNGTWVKTDYVNGPSEARGKDYFGVMLGSTGTTAIEMDAINTPKLLFTFTVTGDCIAGLSILESTDPFYFDPYSGNPPNSLSLNINNNFDVLFPTPSGVYPPYGWNPGYASNYTGSTGACDNPLPVTLLGFEAVGGEGGVRLSWSTSMEQNSDYFGIERSADGKTWVQLAQERAQGNSDIRHDYGYTDAGGGQGAVYYRLRMVDKDGSQSYSAVRRVLLGGGTVGSAIRLYPNPATDRVQFSGQDVSRADLTIYSAEGRVAGWYPDYELGQGLDVSRLSGGTYQLRLTSSQGTQVLKLVVTR